MRRRIFRLAAPVHPLVQQADRLFEQTELETKTRIAKELGSEWEDIEAAFYSDMMEFHCLKKFIGYPDAAALLSRYNVAQVQVALYSATEMVIRAEDDFKTILRHAKLAGLLHRIKRISPGTYEIHLDGPASMLRQTRRYGVFMAGFLPKLIACQGWSMRARERWYPFVGQVGGVIKDDLAIQVQAAFGKLLKYASSGVRSSSEEWVRFEL